MKYFLDDGDKYLRLKFIEVDSDGDTILAIIPEDEIVIDAEEYVLHLNEEMACSGDHIGMCLERMKNYYQQQHPRLTIIYDHASDDVIQRCFLNDYDENRKENGNPELSIDEIRSMF